MEKKYSIGECPVNSLKVGDTKCHNHHPFEITRIDNPQLDKLPENMGVFVCGENDEQEKNMPHFHIMGDNFQFELNIRHIHNLDILRSMQNDKWNNTDTWNSRMDIHDAVLEWLDKPNSELAPMTNAAAILAQWNLNNPEHKIPQSWKD